ncbi:unnamed protein product, partial [Choristocarpus tenellus]
KSFAGSSSSNIPSDTVAVVILEARARKVPVQPLWQQRYKFAERAVRRIVNTAVQKVPQPRVEVMVRGVHGLFNVPGLEMLECWTIWNG